jgi:curved DNA-binding protein CbpA
VARKIKEMDFYDLLNLRPDATPKQVENAYLLAVATYHEDGLASYGVLSAAERQLILQRIEQAFQTLRDPAARKAYDAAVLAQGAEPRPKAYFRRTTEKLEIEDAAGEETLWGRLRARLVRSWPRKRKEGRPRPKNGKDRLALLEGGHYYYGEYLKRIRERRGISLERMAEDCLINSDLLRALEEENYDALPPGEDPSRLLSDYARCLGLNPENGRE